jgi:hypothetical protein
MEDTAADHEVKPTSREGHPSRWQADPLATCDPLRLLRDSADVSKPNSLSRPRSTSGLGPGFDQRFEEPAVSASETNNKTPARGIRHRSIDDVCSPWVTNSWL